jgi:hypothetical protein
MKAKRIKWARHAVRMGQEMHRENLKESWNSGAVEINNIRIAL